MAITGKVYDIQGFSVQDGPGIRTTVFLKGCPLRCPWCHSPESQEFHTQLSWISMRCIGTEKCGKSLTACPEGAITKGSVIQHMATKEDIRLVNIDRELCNNCGACAAVCYPEALYMCGTDYTMDELTENLIRDKPFYKQSCGGVTISGGEPLSQFDFTLALLISLKEKSIHTALDTTGFTSPDKIDAVLPHTDLFLYDLKHMKSDPHKKVIGVSNEIILENAKRIADAGGKMQIRIPVISRFNDNEENIREAGEFCRSLGDSVTVIQLLPYHNLGVMKHLRINSNTKAVQAPVPTEEKIQSLKNILEQMGLSVTVH
ncbi:MAG: glycyl-radical enzyme activating protein [Deltaproteobacteria bacterium]|nr:glycyl-radical enzyme activating protein [Deltaproteobacteria bacterium]